MTQMQQRLGEFFKARRFLAAKILVLAMIPAITAALLLSEVDGFWTQTLSIQVVLRPQVLVDVCEPANEKGYWKNQEEHLAQVLSQGPIDLGDTVVTTVEEAVEVLSHASAKDARDALRAHLLATLLNLANGANPGALGFEIGPTVDAAVGFLASHAEPVTKDHPDRDDALDLKDTLEEFNESGHVGCGGDEDEEDDEDHGDEDDGDGDED